jgi:hypothetical protein
VSLSGFQRALADMVAAPELAMAVRRRDSHALEPYDLSDRERRRLEAVALQPGMDVNCTLYRGNRLTPIVMLLPYTCFVLGDRMKSIAERFWADSHTDLQFRNEIEHFAAFVRELIRTGAIEEPLLEEILSFELAANELRFLPRRQIAQRPADACGSRLALHPLVRLVRFRHDPKVLLELLAAMAPLPYDLEEGDYPLLLVAGAEELDVRRVDPRLARMLEALADDGLAIDPDDVQLLIEEGLVARTAD